MSLNVRAVLETVIEILKNNDELDKSDRDMLADMLESAKRNL